MCRSRAATATGDLVALKTTIIAAAQVLHSWTGAIPNRCAGRDRFVSGRVIESPITAGLIGTIADFTHGQELIDLRGQFWTLANPTGQPSFARSHCSLRACKISPEGKNNFALPMVSFWARSTATRSPVSRST